jgi:cellulose synthase/poly-beta-1,6-N-acetylglucosamine synthase-like glycosyltransferase
MSQGHPLISVIVPCFNHGHYLAEPLNSIVRQTQENWERLIIDDDSSGKTAEGAARFVGGIRGIDILTMQTRGLPQAETGAFLWHAGAGYSSSMSTTLSSKTNSNYKRLPSATVTF